MIYKKRPGIGPHYKILLTNLGSILVPKDSDESEAQEVGRVEGLREDLDQRVSKIFFWGDCKWNKNVLSTIWSLFYANFLEFVIYPKLK